MLSIASALLLLVPAIGGSTTPKSEALPIGTGPVPVQFNLTDNQGAWFNTNVNLFGTSSLSVAVLPRVGINSLLGLANDLVTGLPSLLNSTLANLTNLPVRGNSATLGSLGVDTEKLLNLDGLRKAVGSTVGILDPRFGRANRLIDQVNQQLAALPASSTVNLAELPVGLDLMGLLGELQGLLTAGVSLPVTVNFDIDTPAAASKHAISSLIYPKGAKNFPINQVASEGRQSFTLTEPGLYAFQCKVHPYMLGAVVVDDPLTPGLDFGKKLVVNGKNNTPVPSNADIIARLVRAFFTITAPANWQRFSNTQARTWDPVYPPAPILMYDAAEKPVLAPLLDTYFQKRFNEPATLPAASSRPTTPGIGEVWVDTQMERTAGKTKSGTATKVDASNWTVARKVALPEINMNNPHNMWTDKENKYIYQTEWFNNKLDVFDRRTGKFIRQTEVGPDPSHVMTRTDTDQLHVALNGGNEVVELSPGATRIDRRIPVNSPGGPIAHPHAHWMSADGHTMVTPNVNTYDSSVVDVPSGKVRKEETGELPIASGMMPDSSKYYHANFLGASVSCISLKGKSCQTASGPAHNKIIDLWENYDPVSGKVDGPFGGLPIQLPVSPDGNALLVANTLTANLTVIDPKTDKVVKNLPCDAGCHGINFGHKLGGGYYAYVSSKFANTMAVVDTDPNGDGNPADAAVVGKFVLDPDANTKSDDQVIGYQGMGGQGVLPIPLAYNGWSQQAPAEFTQLTCRQRNPITFTTACQ